MHRPKEVTSRLGISSTTLRRWAATFADYLSPTAGVAIAETGGHAQRRYTDADVALLAAIKRELDGGRTVDETLVRLQRGDLRPDPVVADHDNTPEQPEIAQRASIEPPIGDSDAALALVGGSDAAQMQAAILALIDSAPTITDALAQVTATTCALQETTEAQQALLAELRAERASLEAARAELQAIRDSPLVPNIDHETPTPPLTWGQRVKRLLSGEA
ncbi:MAG: MerR family transcriptional regulator [Dehalococcoidia bacterium]